MSNGMENFIDKTVLSTPKPCASSTIGRKEILRKIDKKYGTRPTDCSNIYEEDESDNSLGIIYNIDEKDDINGDIKEHLKKQRELAHRTLEKSKIGLPSRFLIPSNTPCSVIKKADDNSTVNESDLLRFQDIGSQASITSDSFVPPDVSTPKSSNVKQPVEQSMKSYCEFVGETSRKIRNSDINLKDLCSDLSRFSISKLSVQSGVSNIGSDIFTPAELMTEKLLKDEESWRAKKNFPVKFGNITDVLNFNNQVSGNEKYSVGDFFKQRSEDINNEFFKTSPVKGDPVPLVDMTNTLEIPDLDNDTRVSSSSRMSATEIYNILAKYETQDAQQILNCTNKKSRQKKLSELNTSITSERDVDEYIASREKNDEANYKVNSYSLSIPCITTTSPTISPRASDSTETAKYDKFCQNLEVQSSSKLSPKLTEVAEKEKTDLSRSGSKFGSYASRSPRYSTCSTRRIGSKCLNTNSPEYTPNSLVSSPTENKENVPDSDRSLTSVRSGSSLDTLPDGKLPIKSSRLELVWGCLKPGRTSVQEFQIRNQLNQKIRMQAVVTGSSFRIAKDCRDTEMLTTVSFMLRPLETKSFSVMFCPTIMGAVSERICFYPILGGEIQHTKRQALTLFGYGGYASCDIGSVMKDSTGRLWLSLGKIDCQAYIEQHVIIKNTGNLFAFTCIDIVTKGPFTLSNLKVEPSEFILKPSEAVTITVRYYPSKEELKHFKRTDVFEVAHLKLVSGAEVTRGRLRRLLTKLREKGTPAEPLIDRLSKPFPGENMPSDLRYLKESVAAMKDLAMQLSFKEITITIEQDLESTLVNAIDMNETSMYHTLYQDGENETGIGDTTIIQRENTRLFKIEPTNIIFTLPIKSEDTLLLQSMTSQEMPFEIKTEPNNLFNVCPNKGVIGPYEITVIKVVCSHNSAAVGSNFGRILIYVDNDVIEVSIRTVFIKAK